MSHDPQQSLEAPRMLDRVKRSLVGSPEPVSDAVLEQFPELRAVSWRRGGLFPRIAGLCLGQRSVAAVTLWRTVYLGARCRPSAELLLHEFRHVQQFAESRAFPLLYLWETVKSGYHLNRYECDARDWAASRLFDSREGTGAPNSPPRPRPSSPDPRP